MSTDDNPHRAFEVDLRLPPMLTILTDASHNPELRTMGWAMWSVCDGKRFKTSGAQHGIPNSTVAEFLGIVYSAQAALNFFRPLANTRVLIQCDNLGAMQWFEGLKKGTLPIDPSCYEQAKTFMYQIMYSAEMRFETRHVKGHSDSRKGARYYCNNWADQEAGERRRALDRTLRMGKKKH